MEFKNSGERASGFRNHTRHLRLGLIVGCHSGLSFGVFRGDPLGHGRTETDTKTEIRYCIKNNGHRFSYGRDVLFYLGIGKHP